MNTYQVKRKGVTATASLVLSEHQGAYEMVTTVSEADDQQRAEDLQLEAKGNLTRNLYAAKWHSERDGERVLWWPSRSAPSARPRDGAA